MEVRATEQSPGSRALGMGSSEERCLVARRWGRARRRFARHDAVCAAGTDLRTIAPVSRQRARAGDDRRQSARRRAEPAAELSRPAVGPPRSIVRVSSAPIAAVSINPCIIPTPSTGRPEMLTITSPGRKPAFRRRGPRRHAGDHDRARRNGAGRATTVAAGSICTPRNAWRTRPNSTRSAAIRRARSAGIAKPIPAT